MMTGPTGKKQINLTAFIYEEIQLYIAKEVKLSLCLTKYHTMKTRALFN